MRAEAQTNNNTYTYLEPLVAGDRDTNVTTSEYFQTGYSIALSSTIALSFVMIVLGGIQWSSSSLSPSLKADAQKRITNALTGLLLALFSYLILRTVNPDLINSTLPVLPPI